MISRALFTSSTWCLASLVLAPLAFAQQAFLKAPSPGHQDRFGDSLSISGDTLVVGVSQVGTHNQGAAYVYVQNGSTWSHQATLFAPNAETADWFGFSVDISGDTLVIGAPSEDSSATGVNGNQLDNGANSSGAAYVFVRSGTLWLQEAYLKASNTNAGDSFGWDVSISDDTIVVGAYAEDGSVAGVNGNDLDNLKPASGAAYVFTRSGSVWSQEAYIKASNPDNSDFFGVSLSLSGDLLAVSAPYETSNSSGVNGNQSDNSFSHAGAVYVYRRSGSAWSQEAYIKASNTDQFDTFGSTLELSGDTLVIGAPFEDSDARGVNGDDTNNLAVDSGAAYVFVRNGTAWSQQAYLKAPASDADDGFGQVAIFGDKIVVGAPRDDSAGAGANSDPLNNALLNPGAAHVFVRTGTTWSAEQFLKPSNPDMGDQFGAHTAIFGDTIAVNAPFEDSSAGGVDGVQSNLLENSGAVYIFDPNGPTPEPLIGVESCFGDGGDQMGCTDCPCGNNTPPGTIGGCRNSTGGSARLFATGDPSVSVPASATTDLRFSLASAPPNAFAILASGDAVAPTGLANPCFGLGSGVEAIAFDGLRCAATNIRRHGGRACDAFGAVGSAGNPWGGEGGPSAGIAQAAGFVAGQSRFFQSIYRESIDLSCMRGLNTSQAIEIAFTP